MRASADTDLRNLFDGLASLGLTAPAEPTRLWGKAQELTEASRAFRQEARLTPLGLPAKVGREEVSLGEAEEALPAVLLGEATKLQSQKVKLCIEARGVIVSRCRRAFCDSRRQLSSGLQEVIKEAAKHPDSIEARQRAEAAERLIRTLESLQA